MKIIMLGASTVGKTTFMMSTYGLMREGKIEGFDVRCKNAKTDKDLMRAFDDFRLRGSYPSATIKMNLYEYDFFSEGDWVMDFSLTDIRGESIHDYDVEELSNEIRGADAVLLFLNGYDILRGADVSDDLDELCVLLNSCFIVDDRQKILTVVFSQMDRAGELTSEKVDKLNRVVSELEAIADHNDNLLYQAVPTACSLECMMDLDYVMVALMLVGYADDVQKRREALEAEVESIERQYGKGFVRGAIELVLEIVWIDVERRKARQRYQELQKEIEKYDKMVEKFNKLYKFIEDYELGTYYQINKREDIFAL